MSSVSATTRTCKKVGALKLVSGVPYICSRTGKKLLWKKKVISKPQLVDWTNHNSKEEIIAAATKSFSEWSKTVRSPRVDINYKFSPETPQEILEWLPASIQFVATRLPTFSPINRTVSVAAMNNDEYLRLLRETYTEDQIAIVKSEYTKAISSGAAGWTDYFVMIWNLPAWIKRDLIHINPYGLKTVGAHEFFHIFQFNASGCVYWCLNEPKETPFWMIEGAPSFVQYQTGQILGAGPYTQGRAKLLDRYLTGTVTPKLPLSAVIATDYSQDPYGIGLAGTEFLVAKIGMEKFIKIVTGVASSPSFAASFEAQAGISLETFYSYFETVRSGLDFPRVIP